MDDWMLGLIWFDGLLVCACAACTLICLILRCFNISFNVLTVLFLCDISYIAITIKMNHDNQLDGIKKILTGREEL